MRIKIKQLLKKEGGFTLVELLAVIAILALIVGISIPLIGNVIGDARDNTDAAQDELVIDAAQLYFVENDTETSVAVADLIDDGFLEVGATYGGTDPITKAEALGE
ncbi:competence type IV pilus major pilin ComGC [Trichococcus alkaliphilus]|uniref:competence type IV pilus major pilin ComGC n=1 Tax=Trichococcus alkaliphilus TaxID=2052943 RepID=UPI000D0B0C5A|nr:prepilin-type N-terminal cleavage/methylation domain-containing protein [Trichococcus alkaliphilus]